MSNNERIKNIESLDSFGKELFETNITKENSLFKEIHNLRNDFAKFQSTLLLNELKIELNYLVDKLKIDFNNHLSEKFNKIDYEISLLNAKIASVDFKLASQVRLKSFFF